MTRAMALELADFGVRVNAVAPGVTRTERLALAVSPAAGAAAANPVEALRARD